MICSGSSKKKTTKVYSVYLNVNFYKNILKDFSEEINLVGD